MSFISNGATITASPPEIAELGANKDRLMATIK